MVGNQLKDYHTMTLIFVHFVNVFTAHLRAGVHTLVFSIWTVGDCSLLTVVVTLACGHNWFASGGQEEAFEKHCIFLKR